MMSGPPPDAGGPAADQNLGAGERRLTRRRALAALAGTTPLLSGCAGLLGDDSDTPTATPPPETPTPTPTDPTASATETATSRPVRHVGFTPASPQEVQYNPLNPDQQPAISHHLLFEPLATYSYADDGFRPGAIRSWHIDEDAVRLQLREDLRWTDGSAVTASDLVTQLRIGRYVEDPIWEWATAVRAADQQTVVVDVDGPRNPAVLERDLFTHRFLRMQREEYGPYLERLANGGGLEELGTLADRDPITCGPFRLAKRDVLRLVTERFDDHPDADSLGVDQYVFRTVGAEGSAMQALRAMDVDSVYNATVPERGVEGFPETVTAVKTPDVVGAGLVPNHDHRHMGERAVRQAIAYAVDRPTAVERSLPLSKTAPAVPAGLSESVRSRWLEGATGAFETYGRGAATDQATDVLEAAGYERRDGSWFGPDGEPLSLALTYPAYWSDWTTIAEAIRADLSAVGIDASLDPRREEYETVLADGEFDLALASWLPDGTVPLPYRTLGHCLWRPAWRAVRYAYPGATTAAGVGGDAAAVTVPAREGDGTMAVAIADRLDALARASDPAARRRHVRDLAWVVNQDLPMIPVAERYNQQWLTTDEWAIPADLQSDPDATVRWAPTWLLRQGKLEYTG